MNYTNRFQYTQTLSVSLEYTFSEDQLMQNFLDNFHQCGKHSSEIVSHKAELRGEEKLRIQKPLSISSLNNDDLNLDSSSGCGRNIEGENTVQTKCSFCGGANHIRRKMFQKDQRRKGKSSCSW